MVSGPGKDICRNGGTHIAYVGTLKPFIDVRSEESRKVPGKTIR